MRLSSFGLSATLYFLLLFLLGRLVTPIGDEPDFHYRFSRIIEGQNIYFSLFTDLIFPLSNNLFGCLVENGVDKFLPSIGTNCYMSIYDVLIRSLISLLPLSPLLILFILRSYFHKPICILNKGLSIQEFDCRIDAVILTFLFPGFLYYIGLLSEEQIFLCISLYLFILRGNVVLTIFIFFALYKIDAGNFFIIIFYFIYRYICIYIYRFINEFILIAFFIVTIFISFWLSFSLLIIFNLFEGAIFQEIVSRVDDIKSALNSPQLYSFNIPLIYRPFVTVSSAVLMTASGMKGIFGYPFFAIGIIYLIKNIFLKYNSSNIIKYNILINILSPLFFIITLVFLMPTYANFKYYTFLLPYIFYGALFIIRARKIFFFNIFLSLLCYSTFIFYILL